MTSALEAPKSAVAKPSGQRPPPLVPAVPPKTSCLNPIAPGNTFSTRLFSKVLHEHLEQERIAAIDYVPRRRRPSRTDWLKNSRTRDAEPNSKPCIWTTAHFFVPPVCCYLGTDPNSSLITTYETNETRHHGQRTIPHAADQASQIEICLRLARGTPGPAAKFIAPFCS